MKFTPIQDANVLSGLIFTGVGVGVVIASMDYDFGSVARMGPGFFPRVLGVVLTALGIVIAVRGFASPRSTFHIERVRPIAAIGGSLALFAWVAPRFGFAPALLGACLLSMLAIPRPSIKELVLVPVVLCAFCSLVFIYGLGLAIPIAKW